MNILRTGQRDNNYGFTNRALVNTGSSTASDLLTSLIRKNYEEWKQNAITWSRYSDAAIELREIYCETRHPNWDGYDAKVISDATFDIAHQFICNLPEWAVFPEIIPDGDGSMGFQWNSCNGKQILTMTMNDSGVIHYAMINGPIDKDHGTKLFDGTIPYELVRKIQTITLA